jgi:phosphoenolpyruvate carboxylase
MLTSSLTDETVIAATRKLLMVPLESYKSVLKVLQIESFGLILALLPLQERRLLARHTVKMALKWGEKITTVEQVNGLFELIKPMLKDDGVSQNAQKLTISRMMSQLMKIGKTLKKNKTWLLDLFTCLITMIQMFCSRFTLLQENISDKVASRESNSH